MRRSRLVLIALLNLFAVAILGWKFATMASMADIFGIAVLALFTASFLLLQRERRRIPAEKPRSD
jgi:hypothetical protein